MTPADHRCPKYGSRGSSGQHGLVSELQNLAPEQGCDFGNASICAKTFNRIMRQLKEAPSADSSKQLKRHRLGMSCATSPTSKGRARKEASAWGSQKVAWPRGEHSVSIFMPMPTFAPLALAVSLASAKELWTFKRGPCPSEFTLMGLSHALKLGQLHELSFQRFPSGLINFHFIMQFWPAFLRTPCLEESQLSRQVPGCPIRSKRASAR